MCRNIKPLFNFDPPASDSEIRNATLQFVRKLSGFQKPSKINEKAFDEAVDRMSVEVQNFLNALETNSPRRNREVEEKKAIDKNLKKFKKLGA